MTKYQSKKDTKLIAHLESTDEKCGTVMLVYETSERKGQTICITKSTLKRWWKVYSEEIETVKTEPKTVEEILKLDVEKINEPYPEPTHQEYIPKPDSVIEYEEKKTRARRNDSLPTQEAMAEMFAPILAKINKTYIVFKQGSWLERKAGYTNLYATEEVWETLTQLGFEFRKNGMKNTKLKVVLRIDTMEQFETISKVLTDMEEK